MVSPAFTPNYPTLGQLSPPQQTVFPLSGWVIYLERCAQCHGELGDGHGPAAANLFPHPRSFRDEPLRWVSAENGLATDSDLIRVIRRGEPNSSMPGFDDLSPGELADVIQVLRQFAVQGIRQAAHNAGIVEAESETWIAQRSLPGNPLSVPPISTDPAVIERGQQLFQAAHCSACHSPQLEAEQGRQPLFDSLGHPLLAPNLVSDRFRGGEDPAAVYHRIAHGNSWDPASRAGRFTRRYRGRDGLCALGAPAATAAIYQSTKATASIWAVRH